MHANPPEMISVSPMEGQETVRSAGLPLLLLLVAGLLIPVLVAVGLTQGSELRVLGAVLALAGGLLVLAQPFWGIIFLIGLFFIRPEDSIPQIQGMRLALLTSLVALLGMWLNTHLRRQPMVRTPALGMMAGFCFTAGFSTLNLGYTSEAVEELLKLLILVVLVVNLVRTPAEFRTLITAVLLFIAYLAAASIRSYYSGGALYQADLARAQGTGLFEDPNGLAATTVAALGMALTRVVTGTGLTRWFSLLLSGLYLWATFLTNSRGGMLALIVVVGVVVMVFVRYKLLAVVLAVVLGFGCLVAGPSRMSNFDSSEDSAQSRFWFWDNGLNLFYDNPLTGVGYLRFIELNGNTAAHNTLVTCFSELGIIGYFFWIGLAYYAFRTPQAAKPPPGADGDAGAGAGEAAAAGPATPATPAVHDVLGTRLGLLGWMVACFWITRTYVPVTYVLLALPVAGQVAAGMLPVRFRHAPGEQLRDWQRILAWCGITILAVWWMVYRYK